MAKLGEKGLNNTQLEKHTPLEIPEWLMLAKGALRIGEVERLFNYKDSSLHSAVRNGTFPKADFVAPQASRERISRMFGGYVNLKHSTPVSWKKETIMAEIKRRQELLENMK
jgi:hypothetical protein